MNTCDCKHVAYCKVDSTQCRLVDDPWYKPDGTIFGYTTRAINQMQGRDFDLIKPSKPKATNAAGLTRHLIRLTETPRIRWRVGCGSGMWTTICELWRV